MYKLVVFDLDGTLADTLSDLATAMNYSLELQGLPTHELNSYRKFVGNGISNLVKLVLMDKGDDEQLCTKVRQTFDSYYPQHLCDKTTIYNGMDNLLKELARLGVKTAVHSNKPHEYVGEILSYLYPEHCFEFAYGNGELFERKPSPQALFHIMAALDVKRDEVLYVGDSDVDVITAHNAGVKVCGVEWGFRGKAELMSAGADFIAKDATQLLSIIKD